MCAYNRVNGVWACENPFTLKTMLKGRYNFSGFVRSARRPAQPQQPPRSLTPRPPSLPPSIPPSHHA